jgi:sulfate permease, SulP family
MIGVVRNVGAGLIASSLSLAYCFSYGALIFTGPLQPFLGQGVAAALITAVTTGCLIAWTSGFRLAIAGPDSNTAAPLATMMAALSPALSTGSPGDAQALVFAALAAATALTGTFLVFLGWGRLGKLARYLPYPVVAGFLASTGWLLVTSAVRMSTDVPPTLASLPAFAAPRPGLLLGLAVGWAALLWLLTAKIKNYLTLPAVLVAATLATHAGVVLLGVSEASVQDSGLMFKAVSGGQPVVPVLTGSFFAVDWTLLATIAGSMAAVAVMAVLTILLNSTGIELATGVEGDLDHELRIQGLANLVSALIGGFVGYVSVSRTLVNRAAGATSRLSGTVVGVVALAVLVGGSDAVSLVPRFVLGGLLMQLGGGLLWDWLVCPWSRLPRREWLLVASIVTITAYFGFLYALVFGALAACVIFALDVSGTDVIRGQFGLNERSSSLVRSVEEMAILAAHGEAVIVLQLHSYLFFGSAYRVQEHLKALATSRLLQMVIFDFSAVTGIDSSAATSFARTRDLLLTAGIRIAVCGLAPAVARVISATGAPSVEIASCANLDEALEQGENAVLVAHGATTVTHRPLVDWLAAAFGNLEYARELMRHLSPVEPAEAGFLCRQGDPTETLLFIERGSVSVLVDRPQRDPVRIRVFGPHTMIGEIGFFLETRRTASLKAEDGTIIWSLGREAFRDLASRRPDIVLALVTYIVRIQSERLAFTTRQVAVL